jgi:hypothetical protein
MGSYAGPTRSWQRSYALSIVLVRVELVAPMLVASLAVYLGPAWSRRARGHQRPSEWHVSAGIRGEWTSCRRTRRSSVDHGRADNAVVADRHGAVGPLRRMASRSASCARQHDPEALASALSASDAPNDGSPWSKRMNPSIRSRHKARVSANQVVLHSSSPSTAAAAASEAPCPSRSSWWAANT